MEEDYRRIGTFRRVQPLRGGKIIIKFTVRNQISEMKSKMKDLATISSY